MSRNPGYRLALASLALAAPLTGQELREAGLRLLPERTGARGHYVGEGRDLRPTLDFPRFSGQVSV